MLQLFRGTMLVAYIPTFLKKRMIKKFQQLYFLGSGQRTEKNTQSIFSKWGKNCRKKHIVILNSSQGEEGFITQNFPRAKASNQTKSADFANSDIDLSVERHLTLCYFCKIFESSVKHHSSQERPGKVF